MLIFKLAWLQVRRRWGRVALIVVPSAVLFGLVMIFVGVEYSMHGLDDQELDARTLRIGAPWGAGWLSMRDIEQVQRVPHVVSVGVEDMSTQIWTEEAGNAEPFGGGGYNPTQVGLFWSNVFYVPPDEIERFARVKNAVILGNAVAERHHWKAGDTVTLLVGAGEEKTKSQFVVTYVATRGVMLDVMICHDGVDEQITGHPTDIGIAFAVVDDIKNLDSVRVQVARVFEGRMIESLGLTLADTKAYTRGRSALMLTIFRSTAVLASLLLFGVIFNGLALSVQERRRGLATLRALGCLRGAMGAIIVVEALFTVLPGALLGTLGTLIYFHGRLLEFGEWSRVAITWQAAALTCGLGVVLATLAAVLPASQVAWMQVLPALRDE